MEATRITVLTEENFRSLIQWLHSDAEAAPAFADTFMTSLDALYMSRSGLRIRRKAATAASKLSLSYITEEKNKEERRRAARESSPLDELEAAAPEAPQAEPMATPTEIATPKSPLPQIGQDALPIPNDDGFLEAGLDSLTLAQAVCWHYANTDSEITRGKAITMSFLQTVVYIIYGTFLAKRRTRLTSEHPQMWKYGPVFPRVYNKQPRDPEANKAAARAIREKDPSLDEFIQRIIRINAEKRITDITKTHTSESSPWGICKKNNPDKIGTQLDDKAIAQWFRKAIDKTK